MKRKRLLAGMTALASSLTMLSSMPLTFAHAATFVQNDFEINYGGWYAESPDDSAKVTAIAGIGFEGSRGMQVTGRTTPADGAVSEKDLYLTGGERYDYSVRVSADTDQHFTLSLTTVDNESGEATTVILDEKDVKGGEWAELSASYKAPKNSKSFKLTITTDTTDDFYFDAVKVDGKAEEIVNAAEVGIKDWIVNYGIRSGNILNGGTINDSAIKNIMLKDCNAIECENETKPDATLVANGSSNTNINVKDNSFAKIADWCAQNHMGFRGHTMVWHSQTPEWFFKENMAGNSGNYVSESVMNQRLESYIKNMFNLYATKYPDLNLYAYDICNECMNDSNGGPRQAGYGNGASPWVAVYGDNHFIDKAFEYARKYAPASCHLFYNDYNEYAGFKRDAILATAKRIKAAGNLDGVGMQSHINANASDGWSGENAYLTAMKMYLEAGLELQITELDISTEGGKYSLDQQANRYKNILKAAVEWNATHTGPNDARVTLFQVWGPNDNNSWVATDRNTGKSNQPLLYDGSNNPKSAYTALQSVVPQSEWGDGTQFSGDPTPTEPELDADGYWFHYTFENGVEGMSGRGSASVATSGDQHYAGSKSLVCTGREDSWNGASTALNTRIFKPGETYSFSADVMYTTGSAIENFYLTLEYTDANGEANWPHVASATAVKGEWVQLANTEFTIPAGASDIKLYVETADSTIDFYVDEFIGAPEGTVIKGAGKGAKLLLGDVTGDGVITSADLSALKAGIKAEKFANAIAQANADVDQSGKVNAADAEALRDFLLTKIKEFPVAEREADVVDFAQMEKSFANVSMATSYKKDNENNPLTTQRFGADPGWMVYGDRLYLYTTNDAFEYYSDGRLQINTYNSGTINCISSADLVNWTDHGAIPAAAKNNRTQNGAAKWANNAWAPDAAWKKINGKDKFFLYFANNGSGVGVLTADSPTGPFVDPIGKEIANASVPGGQGVLWQFDPAVYYDPDTDEAYLAYGGGVPSGQNANPGTGRIGKLSSDMLSIDGSLHAMETPYLFEDSSLIKIGNLWYYSYCTNWAGGGNVNGVQFGSADICYMTSSNPLGPWTSSTLSGMVFANTGSQRIDNGGNNHHSIIEFKGKYYVAYHSRQQALRMGITAIDGSNPNDRSKDSKDGNYRSTQLNEATFINGKITCKGDMTGITKQLENVNPFETVQAETMANQSTGISVNGLGDTTVAASKGGCWTKIKGVDFANGCSALTVRASSKSGAVIKVMDGNGKAFAYAEIPAGGSMTEYTFACNSISGVNDITFEFSNQVEFDSWSFTK